MQTISFLQKRNGPHPKEKSRRGLGRILLSPAPGNTVITGKHPFRALRPAIVRLSEQNCTLPGRLGGHLDSGVSAHRAASPAPGGRPQGVPTRPESTPHYRRRRTGEQPAFSHRFPAPGGDELSPSLSKGPFSLAARNRFFLGPSKKKWVWESLTSFFGVPGRQKTPAGASAPAGVGSYFIRFLP